MKKLECSELLTGQVAGGIHVVSFNKGTLICRKLKLNIGEKTKPNHDQSWRENGSMN